MPRVVPIALVSGWGGPKVLSVIQDRVLAAAKEERLQAAANVAKSQVENIANSARASVQEADSETARRLVKVSSGRRDPAIQAV